MGVLNKRLRSLKRVPQQDPEFLTEIIEPLVHCYNELDINAGMC